MDIIAGDFNYDLLKVLESKILDLLTDHYRMVSKPTQISGFLIADVFIKSTLMRFS